MNKRRLFYAVLFSLAALGITAGAVLAHQPAGSEETHRENVTARTPVTWNLDQGKLDEIKARFGDRHELKEKMSRFGKAHFNDGWAGMDRDEIKARFGDRFQWKERTPRFRNIDLRERLAGMDWDEIKARFGDRSELKEWSSRLDGFNIRDRFFTRR